MSHGNREGAVMSIVCPCQRMKKAQSETLRILYLYNHDFLKTKHVSSPYGCKGKHGSVEV